MVDRIDRINERINEIDKKIALIAQIVEGDGVPSIADRIEKIEQKIEQIQNNINKIFIIGIVSGAMIILLSGKIEWLISKMF